MSDSGSHPADLPRDGADDAERVQPSPEQPYDVPTGAQQYGQPPATGYQPPETDPPGQWAPVQGGGPQQYGQPEHGQASYAQEGFPAPGNGPHGYEPVDPGQGEPSAPGVPSGGDPTQGYAPQAPAYEQQAYGEAPPYVTQHPYGQPPSPGQPYAAPGQAPYAGQPPYPGQPAYGQQPYGQQPYAGQPPYVPQGQAPYPGQGYPAQPYPGQPYPAQPYAALAPMSESDQRLWATLTHVSTLVLGFVGPLVAYLVLKDRSPFLKQSTTEALNFSITLSIAAVVSSILTVVVVGYVLLPLVYVGALVLCILAAVASNRGEVYRYPLSLRLVK